MKCILKEFFPGCAQNQNKHSDCNIWHDIRIKEAEGVADY